MSLVGIYSFPKSGNTWLRHIIGDVVNAGPRQIPDLHQQKLSEAKEFNGMRFFKHHGGRNFEIWKGQKLHTTHVIHIRRNPLDVFLSYLNFISDNVMGTAPIKFSSVEAIEGTRLFDLYLDTFITTGHVVVGFANITRSYFENNRYWMTQQDVPAICLKYEDLLSDPEATLAPVKDLLGIDDETLAAALSKASASTRVDGKFFWKQQAKNYLGHLTAEQIDLFLEYRGEDCRQLGYDPADFHKPA